MHAVLLGLAVIAQPPGSYCPPCDDYEVCRFARPRYEDRDYLRFENQRRGIRLTLQIGPERTREYYDGPRYVAPRYEQRYYVQPRYEAPRYYAAPNGGGCYGGFAPAPRGGCYGPECYGNGRSSLPQIGVREAYVRP